MIRLNFFITVLFPSGISPLLLRSSSFGILIESNDFFFFVTNRKAKSVRVSSVSVDRSIRREVHVFSLYIGANFVFQHGFF